MIRKSYGKAVGISLLIHSILLTILVMGEEKIEPASYRTTPIQVEFISARVLDTAHTLPDSKPLEMESSSVLSQSAVAGSQHQLQEQALTTEDSQMRQRWLPDTQVRNEVTTVQTATAGLATATSSNIGSGNQSDGDTDKKNRDRGQDAKPLLISKASHISGLRPAYPSEARHAGWEGTVVIRILVSTDGSPAAVSVRTSSGYSVLDEAAAQGVKNWRFSPERHGDTPIESYYDVRVKFNLADE